MKEYYVQMATGKRSQTLGRAHSDDMLSPLGSGAARDAPGEALLRWRRDRGFANPPGSGAWPAEHPCAAAAAGGPSCTACTFAGLGGGVFVCERSGWAHVCDEGCRERVVDHSSDLLVCPVSGRCFDRMLSAHEEEQQCAGGNAGGFGGGVGDDDYYSTGGERSPGIRCCCFA